MYFIYIEYLLPLRKTRAIQVRNNAERELGQLIEKSPGNISIISDFMSAHCMSNIVSFSEDDICDWLAMEQRQQQTVHSGEYIYVRICVMTQLLLGTETPSWTTEYFSYLQQYYHLWFVCDIMVCINDFFSAMRW